MKNGTYHIITIGCQMNKADSERIAACFEELGFIDERDRNLADFVVFTTCGVRQSAEDRVYGLVSRVKKENQNVKIILAGCLSERDDVLKRLEKYVNIWLPSRKIGDLQSLIHGLLESEVGGKKTRIAEHESCDYLKVKPRYSSVFSAFVPIGNGCDNYCSYCVVPYARGREAYRPAGEILGEIKDLAVRGYKEIILIAQNVNSYHSQFSSNYQFSHDKTINFSDLLRMANDIPGDFWIRFSTSHPKDMSDDLVAAIRDCEKICRHIHLPVQAGDDEVLRRMNRNYTIEHYKGLIEKIKNLWIPAGFEEGKLSRENIPVSLSTDIIVGFPGETAEQFNKTLKLFAEARYDMAYIAQYSPRPGTAAEKLADDIAPEEKKRRENELDGALRKTALANNRFYLGKTVRVLVEEQNKKGFFLGKTETNKTVKFLGGANLVGSFVDIKIMEAADFGLNGILA